MKKTIEMPDVIDMNLTDAKKTLKELNLEIEVIGESIENGQETIITNQLPKKGIKVQEGTTIKLYIN